MFLCRDHKLDFFFLQSDKHIFSLTVQQHKTRVKKS